MEDFASLQKDVQQLRVDILRNPMVNELRITAIEKRLSDMELWKASIGGGMKVLGGIVVFCQFLVMVIEHFWK